MRARDHVVGLGAGVLENAVGLGARLGERALGQLVRIRAHEVRLVFGGAAELLGVDVGLGDEPRGLLFGDAQGVLELRAETGEGRAADLFELGGELFDAREKALVLLGVLGGLVVRSDDVAAQSVDGLVDLVLVVSAEHLRELGFFDGHSSSGIVSRVCGGACGM